MITQQGFWPSIVSSIITAYYGLESLTPQIPKVAGICAAN